MECCHGPWFTPYLNFPTFILDMEILKLKRVCFTEFRKKRCFRQNVNIYQLLFTAFEKKATTKRKKKNILLRHPLYVFTWFLYKHYTYTTFINYLSFGVYCRITICKGKGGKQRNQRLESNMITEIKERHDHRD